MDTSSSGSALALTRFRTSEAGRITLLYGANVTGQIYLNGLLVKSHAQHFFQDDLEEIPLDVQEGDNQLLVEVDSDQGHSVAFKYGDIQIHALLVAPDGKVQF